MKEQTLAFQQENELQSAARQIFLLRLGMFSLLLFFLNVILSQCFGLIDTQLSFAVFAKQLSKPRCFALWGENQEDV